MSGETACLYQKGNAAVFIVHFCHGCFISTLCTISSYISVSISPIGLMARVVINHIALIVLLCNYPDFCLFYRFIAEGGNSLFSRQSFKLGSRCIASTIRKFGRASFPLSNTLKTSFAVSSDKSMTALTERNVLGPARLLPSLRYLLTGQMLYHAFDGISVYLPAYRKKAILIPSSRLSSSTSSYHCQFPDSSPCCCVHMLFQTEQKHRAAAGPRMRAHVSFTDTPFETFLPSC
jgi:hypothetical protein